MATKVIVTHSGALAAKYGDRAADVQRAIDDLIAADAGRDVQTQLVALDDSAGAAGSSAVTDAADADQAKGAVDAVAKALSPDYLMLLGGPDVVPHCPLDNPAQGDDDATVPSDLPFACDAPASKAPQDFLAPTRVVARLPDVPGASDPDVLLRELAVATSWTSHPAPDSPLGISAEVWENSTALSLTQLYGASGDMQVAPDDGPDWADPLLSRRVHFINCHGAPDTPQFFGQRGDDYPVAHDAALVDGHLTEGTILAAECCYGGQLFEPTDGALGMPFAYLRSGAYGVFASTTIAYGPANSNDQADVICRQFVASVAAGASIGRAGLEAYQGYIAASSPLDPIDLKTIAQFVVLGDPSVHPVAAAQPGGAGLTKAKGVAAASVEERREVLASSGYDLGRTVTYAEAIDAPASESVLAAMRAALPEAAGETRVASFSVSGGVGQKGFRAIEAPFAAAPQQPAKIHLLMTTLEASGAPLPPRIAVLALEEGGEITSLKRAVSR